MPNPNRPPSDEPAYRRPKAERVSAIVTNWPGYAFTVGDIINLAYARELAEGQRVDAASGTHRSMSDLRQSVKTLMKRNGLRRLITADGCLLQPGELRKAYGKTPLPPPTSRQVWRSMPLDHPMQPGTQTTDDWLISWQPPLGPRSAPLSREAVVLQRMASLVPIFVQQPDRMFSLQELLMLQHPGSETRAYFSRHEHGAQRGQVNPLYNMIRDQFSNHAGRQALDTGVAEYGLRMQEGRLIRRLPGYTMEDQGLARLFFRAANAAEPVPEVPTEADNLLIEWRQFSAEPES